MNESVNESVSSAAGSEVAGEDVLTETVLQPEPVDHPLMTTSFADYTVTEGLLLLIFITLFVGLIIKVAKEVI